ncbi:MAG: GTPase [Chloroflexota bacterium]
MPMPHDVQMQLIKRDLVGKDGAERGKVLRKHLAALPTFQSGPYADMRRWLKAEIERMEAKEKSKHQDTIAVPKEGHRQIALIGAPNAGKSALLRALSGIRIKVADYAFATLRPTASIIKIHGALIQMVEVPGLIDGAAADRGGGRALLATARNADAVLFVASVRDEPDALATALQEYRAAGIDKPAALCVTGADLLLPDDPRPASIAALLPELRWVVCSPETGQGIDALRDLIWDLSALMRIYSCTDKKTDDKPFILDRGATVIDLARTIHHDLAARFRSARVWGSSTRFSGQTVGPQHVLADGDIVDILASRR